MIRKLRREIMEILASCPHHGLANHGRYGPRGAAQNVMVAVGPEVTGMTVAP